MARSVWKLPRNNVDACRALFEERSVTDDEWRVMLLLQDDPRDLVEAAKGWRPPATPGQ